MPMLEHETPERVCDGCYQKLQPESVSSIGVRGVHSGHEANDGTDVFDEVFHLVAILLIVRRFDAIQHSSVETSAGRCQRQCCSIRVRLSSR